MILFLFPNIHHVMAAEEALKNASVPCALVPTPKEHSKECGMSVEIDEEQEDAAERALQNIPHRSLRK